MSAADFLVEVRTEELPPKALKKLGESFAGVLLEQLKAQGLASGDSTLTAWGDDRTTNVPEPATLGLIGLGLLGFAASRKKKI